MPKRARRLTTRPRSSWPSTDTRHPPNRVVSLIFPFLLCPPTTCEFVNSLFVCGFGKLGEKGIKNFCFHILPIHKKNHTKLQHHQRQYFVLPVREDPKGL